MNTGYLHPAYASSLSEFGLPHELPACGGWMLKRRIPGFSDFDAMGCYPIFVCQDWSQLEQDLEAIKDDLVSLSLVTDPFGEYQEEYLKRCFRDMIVPFKEHFIVDLKIPLKQHISRNSDRSIRRAFRVLEGEVCQNPMDYLDDWVDLYNRMVKRFDIHSVRAFSRSSLAKQLSVPGLFMYRASYQGESVGIATVFVQNNAAYGHLIAMDEVGYRLGASYVLYTCSIEHLKRLTRWYDLGGAPGITSTDRVGLKDFKNRWATHTRWTYFCGRIFNRQRYAEISGTKNISHTTYFPAYRSGEFA